MWGAVRGSGHSVQPQGIMTKKKKKAGGGGGEGMQYTTEKMLKTWPNCYQACELSELGRMWQLEM